MPTISRATIKSYDAATHSAAVQIAGSLTVWLDAVPVSDAISPSDVVAGRECGVIFFTDDNPQDAAVVTVHNALPVGSHRLRDADGDTYVDVERTANENIVAMAVGGTVRWLLGTASPHETLTGDSYISGDLAVGPTAVNDSRVLILAEDSAGAATYVGIGAWVGGSVSVNTNNFVGIAGKVVATNTSTTVDIGLDFAVNAQYGATVKTLGTFDGIRLTMAINSGSNLTITNAIGLDVGSVSYSNAGFTLTTSRGVYVRGGSNNRIGTKRGVQVDSETATTTANNPFYDLGFASTRDADGNRFRSNTQFGSVTGAFGGGDGVIGLAYAATNPGTNPAGGVVIYVSAASGDFKIRGNAGQICTLPTGGAGNVTGSRAGNAALASLLTALAALGLIVDGTT